MIFPSQLGDCLLHGEHHEMGKPCVEMMVNFLTHQINDKGRTVEEAIYMYAYEYEKIAMWALRLQLSD